jgi:succinoglycan biosynthesis transport protein ExoP
MTQSAAALNTVWHRKWWILVPTVLAAAVTSVVSYYFLPPRYRSEATILVVAQRVPEEYVRSSVTAKLDERLRAINQQVRSRVRLERIIEELNLYSERRKTDIMQDIVDDMSQLIDVDIVQGDVFRIAFSSASPRTAMQVADRLTTFFIDENLKNRAQLAEQTGDFIQAQIADVRRRIIEYENELRKLKAANGHEPLSQADLLPYEVLQERYKELLIKGEESRSAVNIERRQIGEQLNILDPARIPKRPVGPDRLRVNVAGTSAGFALGLIFLGFRRRSETVPQRDRPREAA